ncbi:hypothetical protein CapIbe_005759 [Capra ibex]
MTFSCFFCILPSCFQKVLGRTNLTSRIISPEKALIQWNNHKDETTVLDLGPFGFCNMFLVWRESQRPQPARA